MVLLPFLKISDLHPIYYAISDRSTGKCTFYAVYDETRNHESKCHCGYRTVTSSSFFSNRPLWKLIEIFQPGYNVLPSDGHESNCHFSKVCVLWLRTYFFTWSLWEFKICSMVRFINLCDGNITPVLGADKTKSTVQSVVLGWQTWGWFAMVHVCACTHSYSNRCLWCCWPMPDMMIFKFHSLLLSSWGPFEQQKPGQFLLLWTQKFWIMQEQRCCPDSGRIWAGLRLRLCGIEQFPDSQTAWAVGSAGAPHIPKGIL